MALAATLLRVPPSPRGTRFSRGDAPRWGVAVVRGESMLPTLRAGDRLLVSYRRKPRPGDLVVARFADCTVAVKRAVERRATRTAAPGWWLLSDNPDRGVDSRHRGVVADSDVIAVTVARIWPRPRWW